MLTEAWRGWSRAGDKSERANCHTVECAVGGENRMRVRAGAESTGFVVRGGEVLG